MFIRLATGLFRGADRLPKIDPSRSNEVSYQDNGISVLLKWKVKCSNNVQLVISN